MRFELMTSSLPRRRSTPELRGRESYTKRTGAGDETRTRDPQLGRLMLYQLSYTRPKLFGLRNKESDWFSIRIRIPKFEILLWCRGQDSNLRKALACRVYSPVPLTTRPPLHVSFKCLMEPAKGLEPPTL
jgi:hypothetical protein